MPTVAPPLMTAPSPASEALVAHKPILSKGRAAIALKGVGLIMAFLLAGRLERRRVSVTQPAIQSLAVLPFKNLSADPSQDYLAAGITEELTTDLANIGAVRVISHTSANQFREGNKPLSEIARELKVDGIVEGAVRRSADRVHITAQLIRIAADEYVWAAAYDREANDVLGVEQDVARAIAGAIRLKLTNAQQSRLAIREATNPAARDFYLKGRYAWNERQPASLARALDFFQRAVAADPAFAKRSLASLIALANKRPIPAYQFSMAYLGLGDVDESMKWLEKAYEERSDFFALHAQRDPIRLVTVRPAVPYARTSDRNLMA